jgi:hypothetical protein
MILIVFKSQTTINHALTSSTVILDKNHKQIIYGLIIVYENLFQFRSKDVGKYSTQHFRLKKQWY